MGASYSWSGLDAAVYTGGKVTGRGCRSSPALSKLASLLSISGEFTPVRWLYEKNSKSYYVLIPRSAPFCGLTIIKLWSLQCLHHTTGAPESHVERKKAHFLQQGAHCHHHLCVRDEKWRLREGQEAAGSGMAAVGTARGR